MNLVRLSQKSRARMLPKCLQFHVMFFDLRFQSSWHLSRFYGLSTAFLIATAHKLLCASWQSCPNCPELFENMSNKCPIQEYKNTRCTSWSFRCWYSWCLPCLHAGQMQRCRENVFQAFTNLEVHPRSIRVANQRCEYNQVSSWTEKQFVCPPPEQVSPAKPTPNRHCHNCFEGRYTLLSCLVFSNIFSKTLRTWSVCHHQMTIQKGLATKMSKRHQLKRERRIRFYAHLGREDLKSSDSLHLSCQFHLPIRHIFFRTNICYVCPYLKMILLQLHKLLKSPEKTIARAIQKTLSWMTCNLCYQAEIPEIRFMSCSHKIRRVNYHSTSVMSRDVKIPWSCWSFCFHFQTLRIRPWFSLLPKCLNLCLWALRLTFWCWKHPKRGIPLNTLTILGILLMNMMRYHRNLIRCSSLIWYML